MKVILTENIHALGQIGQLVNVAPGYARNYLLPQGLALEATGKNVKELEHQKRILEQKRERVHQEMLSLADKLNKVEITMRRKVSEDDKLYGSVSATDVLEILEEKGFEISRRSIGIEPIKQLGEFMIPIRIDAQITANVKLVVAKEE
jgi:large subunit ribosomal protein L9